MISQIVSNGVMPIRIPAGLVLTVTPDSPGSVATVSKLSEVGATGFITQQVNAATSIGPFGFDCLVSVCALGDVSVLTRIPSAGGAGASAFTDLTDKATADLPTLNTPLAQALAAKAPSMGITRAMLSATVKAALDKSDALGSPSAEAADRALVAADNGKNLIGAGRTYTVPDGLGSGFGVSAKGAVTFTASGTAVVTDIRTTGATNPWCALVQTGTDTYDVVGGKA